MLSLALAVTAVAAFGVMLWRANAHEEELDQELIHEFLDLAGEPGDGGALSREISRRMLSGQAAGGVYLYAESSARIITGSLSSWPEEIGTEDGHQTVTLPRSRSIAVERHLRVLARSLPDGRRLAVGRDVTERERMQRLLAWGGVASLAIALLLGIGSGLFVSRGLLGRVEAMSDTVLGILRGGRRERVPTHSKPDEFDALANHFNQLLDENEALVGRMRDVTNEVAHDLRTPLAHVRTRIESALAEQSGASDRHAELLVALRDDVNRILETFNALLHIAQIETGRAREEMQPVDLTRLALDVCELYEPAAEEAGLRIVPDVASGIEVTGHPHLLAQALTNLIENALKYAGRGDVRVALGLAGDTARLSVSDEGPGIAAADRTRALQRFARLEASRTQPGAGLGLALVAAVADLHGAELRLEEAGPGLRVVLDLRPGGPESRA